VQIPLFLWLYFAELPLLPAGFVTAAWRCGQGKAQLKAYIGIMAATLTEGW